MSLIAERRRTSSTATTSDHPAPSEQREPFGARRVLAILRIAMGFVFLWAFLDKLLGLGFATASQKAWINGGSPTNGFLSSIDVGPFKSLFQSIAGSPWADWLFMLGLLGIGLGLLFGIALRISAVSATLLLLFMWAAEWPLARFTEAGKATSSSNPLIDSHIIYAGLVIVLALTLAGGTWGLGKAWAKLPFVARHRWLV